MKNFGIIIQARTGSSRMPKKVLKPVVSNENSLDIIYNRLKCLNLPIVFAIPQGSKDDELFHYLKGKNYNVFRGSENNVLERTVVAAQKFKIDYVIRVCSDNLLIQASLIEKMVAAFTNETIDYVSYYLNDDTPTILTHFGFFAEIAKRTTLESVLENVMDSLYLEHVTNYIHQNPTKFKIKKLPLSDTINEWHNKVRLTIDTIADFEILKNIYPKVETFDIEKIIEYIALDTELLQSMQTRINQYKK